LKAVDDVIRFRHASSLQCNAHIYMYRPIIIVCLGRA